jgi:predicted nucleic acid-binding protein
VSDETGEPQKTPKDYMFITTAIVGQASHIVSGDKKHLLILKEADGVQIISVNAFLQFFD